ncbi:MAG: DUF695 domain-containing protein [Saprospiraceae bacterium]
MKNLSRLLLLFFLFAPSFLFSQDEEDWDVYLATYDEGPGATTVRMDLINVAPLKGYPFIIIAGVKYEPDEHGFPLKPMDDLHLIEDSLTSALSTKEAILAGAFTHQGERLSYFYVKDTFEIRSLLEKKYLSDFPNIKYPPLRIEDDKEWGAYLTFLYPNEDIQNYMGDQAVLEHLESVGDDMTTPRQLDHWVYFATEADGKEFIKEIKTEGFQVVGINKLDEGELPFQLQFKKESNIDLDSVYELTTHLRLLAKKYNGDYDGWETFIVKKE